MSTEPAVPSPFASRDEFREVIDAVFALMRDDPDIGPRLRAGNVPQRYVFDDVGLAFNVRSGAAGEPNIVWAWAAEPPWPAAVELTMTSSVANRYFQGHENVPIAVARRRIRATGRVKAALALMPVTRPVFPQYRALLADRYPHLTVSTTNARTSVPLT